MPKVLVEPASPPPAAAAQGALTLSAPARVNLLGEHTDYTGGLVMPLAIPFYTRAVISPNLPPQYLLQSEDFEGTREVPIDVAPEPTHTWSDYPLGVLSELKKLGHEIPAFHLDLSGNVPLGAGLSSSASVEIASCLAMLRLAQQAMSPQQVALLCQRAENQFVGSPCGIMDQFVIAAAVADHALLIHTRDLSFDLIPLNRGRMKDICVVVFNSMVKHSVAGGEYGDRRKQLETGQAILHQRFPQIADLGQATLAQLLAVEPDMPHLSFLRCRHVITENARVLQAKELLEQGALEQFGALMLQAHASQRDDFQCSCDEIDFLVEAAMRIPGCFGARLTGGGFGGCTVNLVQRDRVDIFIHDLETVYQQRFGIKGEAYPCEAVDGAMKRNGFALD